MPTPYISFTPYLHLTGLRDRLREIDPAEGYNTRPHLILTKWPGVMSVPRGSVPALFLHASEMQEDPDNRAVNRVRLRFALTIFGVAEDDDDPEAVGMALLADVLAAVFRDERSIGGTTGLDFRLTRVVWDSEATENRSGFSARFESLIDLKRSSTP